jgi:hypothetical protein
MIWPFSRERESPKWTINLHPSVAGNLTVAGAWTTYAGVKVLYRTGQYFETHPEARDHQSPFEEECCARDALAEFWAAQNRDTQRSDTYLHLLMDVRRAGFIREYVWRYLRQADMATPERLNRRAFDAWVCENDLAFHQALTLAFPSQTGGSSRL